MDSSDGAAYSRFGEFSPSIFLTCAHPALKPARSEGAAIFQALAVLPEDVLIAVINHAYTLAFAAGREVVSWEDLRDAFIAWQGGFFSARSNDILTYIVAAGNV